MNLMINFKKGGLNLSLFEKFHTLIILFAVILGIVLGHIPIIEGNADKLIVPFLLLMLFGLFFYLSQLEI